MKKIPIVMTLDSNYVFQTGIAISTMLQNKKDEVEYIFYILNNGKLTPQEKQFIENVYTRKQVHYISIDENRISAKIGVSYVPIASYYRLLISRLLAELDKCIFIDGDVIVLGGLEEAYDTELEDFYLAAVADCGIKYNAEKYGEHLVNEDIADIDTYFNAGFLVLNLKKMREEFIEEQLLSLIEKKYRFMDQDILNKCCVKRVKYLPLKYNILFGFFQNEQLLLKKGYNHEELQEMQRHPIVLHYASGNKPWVNPEYDVCGLWWKQAEKIKECGYYNSLFEFAQNNYINSKWKNLVDKCKSKEAIVIFGASDIGYRVVDWLINCGIRNICAICDNDEKKQGKSYRDIPIASVDKVLEEITGSYEIVVTSQRYFADIVKQLHELRVEDKDIYEYSHKSWYHYYKIDNAYYEEEVEEIFLKRYGTLEGYENQIQKWTTHVKRNCESFQELYEELFEYQV